MVFGRGGGLFGAEQTVPTSEVYAGIQALRVAPRKTPPWLYNKYFVSTARRGRTPWGNAAICGTSIGCLSSTTLRRSVSSSRAPPASGHCGQGVSHSGCVRGTSLLVAPALRMDRQENCACEEFGQDGTEGRCHGYPAHGRAVLQVHTGVPCSGPPVSVHHWKECIRHAHEILAGRRGLVPLKSPSACRFAARSSCVAGCQRRAHRGKRKMCSSSRPAVEQLCINERPQGAHDFPSQGRHGRRPMWGIQKLRRDCPGKSSKLGMEVLKRLANQVTSGLSLSTLRRQPRCLWREFDRDPRHFVPCPNPHGALEGKEGRTGRGLGGECAFSSGRATSPWERRVGFLSSSLVFAVLV